DGLPDDLGEFSPRADGAEVGPVARRDVGARTRRRARPEAREDVLRENAGVALDVRGDVELVGQRALQRARVEAGGQLLEILVRIADLDERLVARKQGRLDPPESRVVGDVLLDLREGAVAAGAAPAEIRDDV